jgi:hypothetical protein
VFWECASACSINLGWLCIKPDVDSDACVCLLVCVTHLLVWTVLRTHSTTENERASRQQKEVDKNMPHTTKPTPFQPDGGGRMTPPLLQSMQRASAPRLRHWFRVYSSFILSRPQMAHTRCKPSSLEPHILPFLCRLLNVVVSIIIIALDDAGAEVIGAVAAERDELLTRGVVASRYACVGIWTTRQPSLRLPSTTAVARAPPCCRFRVGAVHLTPAAFCAHSRSARSSRPLLSTPATAVGAPAAGTRGEPPPSVASAAAPVVAGAANCAALTALLTSLAVVAAVPAAALDDGGACAAAGASTPAPSLAATWSPSPVAVAALPLPLTSPAA